jgi:hypothetical protein
MIIVIFSSPSSIALALAGNRIRNCSADASYCVMQYATEYLLMNIHLTLRSVRMEEIPTIKQTINNLCIGCQSTNLSGKCVLITFK